MGESEAKVAPGGRAPAPSWAAPLATGDSITWPLRQTRAAGRQGEEAEAEAEGAGDLRAQEAAAAGRLHGARAAKSRAGPAVGELARRPPGGAGGARQLTGAMHRSRGAPVCGAARSLAPPLHRPE